MQRPSPHFSWPFFWVFWWLATFSPKSHSAFWFELHHLSDLLARYQGNFYETTAALRGQVKHSSGWWKAEAGLHYGPRWLPPILTEIGDPLVRRTGEGREPRTCFTQTPRFRHKNDPGYMKIFEACLYTEHPGLFRRSWRLQKNVLRRVAFRD